MPVVAPVAGALASAAVGGGVTGAVVGAATSGLVGSALGGGSSADSAINAATDAGKAQVALANAQWKYYKQKFGPLEGQLIDQVTNQPVQPDLQGVSDRASADVIQAYDKAKRMTNRNLGRLGINQGSDAIASANRQLMLDQARTEALAVNTALQNEKNRAEDVNFNRKVSVTGLGKGIPQQVNSGLNAGAANLQRSAAMYGDAATSTARALTPAISRAVSYGVNNFGLPDPGQSYSSWGGNVTGGGFWDGNTGLYNSDGSAYYDSANDFYADFADGGEIRKPGRGLPVMVNHETGAVEGVADDVPINASEGEYVIPADVVRRKGTEFFDKLLDKHHTPAAVQRVVAGIPGMVRPGNIDLAHRQVVHNQNGSISTERSISINVDGKEVLIPTVIDGRVVSSQEAIRHYMQTGENLGVFDNPQHADNYAERLHERQAARYGDQSRGIQVPAQMGVH